MRSRHSRLLAAALVAEIAATGCAGGKPGAWSAGETTYGRRLLERKCQGCHATPVPGQFTREKWVKELGKMRSRFHLPESDWDTLMAMVPRPAGGVEPETVSAR